MKDIPLYVNLVVKTLNLENFTLSFCRLRQINVLKCVPHVQHDYFSSFHQSAHCFSGAVAPVPSSLLILAILHHSTVCTIERHRFLSVH